MATDQWIVDVTEEIDELYGIYTEGMPLSRIHQAIEEAVKPLRRIANLAAEHVDPSGIRTYKLRKLFYDFMDKTGPFAPTAVAPTEEEVPE